MTTRRVLRGLLRAPDISLEGITSLLGLDVDVVRLFEALFFYLRERGDGFPAGVLFPEIRLGAVVEAEKDFDDLERTLMRVGEEGGWREVARLAGPHTMEDAGESSESMLARAGHLNCPPRRSRRCWIVEHDGPIRVRLSGFESRLFHRVSPFNRVRSWFTSPLSSVSSCLSSAFSDSNFWVSP